MRIYVGEKLLELSDTDLENMYVNEGKEAFVYRYGDEALKIYKDERVKLRLDEEDTIKLSEISTERVLLPKEVIYDDDFVTFKGYSTPFIDRESSDAIVDMDIMQFVDELDIIDSDLKKLANSGVLVDDLSIDNVFYNGKMFLGDPGSYVFVERAFPAKIYRSNMYELTQFVKEEIFSMIPLSFEEQVELDIKFDKFKYIGEQIRNSASSGESVKQYVKRIAS